MDLTREQSPRDRLLDDLPLTERTLLLGGVSTMILEGGTGRQPVVLLHGLGEFAAAWMRVMPDLVTTHHLIVPDLPGEGASQVLDGPLDAARVDAWLRKLIETTCPVPPVLVGHTSSGAAAARFVITHPELAAGLVLVDSYGLAAYRPAVRFALALGAYVVRPGEWTGTVMMRQCLADLDRTRAELGPRWEPFMAYAHALARTPSVHETGRKLMPELGLRVLPTADLAAISVPTTLIWGRQDRQVRLHVAEAASRRFGWPLHVIDDAADDPAFERPEAFLRALRTALPAPTA